MTWMKVDDKLHAHRKTRKAITTAEDKRRDAAPMGLWVLAGSWAGQNGTSGWVPEHELDRWDDDWHALAARLVKAGFWWPEQRDDEPGYGFVDWDEYNPSNGSSDAGRFGNHKRWHLDRNLVDLECAFCPKPPVDFDDDAQPCGFEQQPSIEGNAAGQPVSIGGRSGGDIAPESRNIALPDPTRPDPDPITPSSAHADADRFEEFWDAYDKKVGRKPAQQKWRGALKKKDVTADLLIGAARRYVNHQRTIGKHPEFTKNPATWLNGEHWADELAPADSDALFTTRLPTIAEVRRMEAEREARERGESA